VAAAAAPSAVETAAESAAGAPSASARPRTKLEIIASAALGWSVVLVYLVLILVFLVFLVFDWVDLVVASVFWWRRHLSRAKNPKSCGNSQKKPSLQNSYQNPAAPSPKGTMWPASNTRTNDSVS
jgi:uncharacterized integral membrane protein